MFRSQDNLNFAVSTIKKSVSIDMSGQYALLSYYLIPIIAIYALYLTKYKKKQAVNRSVFQDSVESGMTTPPSLHPIINKDICIGCEACVHACPEFPAHNVLGVIGGKANLISPTDCIGHGACKTACPVAAISLVFGTSERGVDIPHVSPEFETNIPGIFIAGELGGMGLIRNAVEQGRQALNNIAARNRKGEDCLDIAIIGAGPAGFAATLAAHEKGMKYVTIEQDALGGTVANFPRGKLVMTAPVELPMYGTMVFRETQKEDLIDFWQSVADQTGVRINYSEKLEAMQPIGNTFTLSTDKGNYRASSVLLALGRRGSPRKLDIPGEQLNKVIYSMIDPAEFAGKKVCIVGGGDSALEAAHTIAEEPGAEVLLSYRSDAFTRAKRKNREKISSLTAAGKLRVVMESQLTEITETEILLSYQQDKQAHAERIPNDAVIVCVGGILPTGFLKDIGIEVETKYGSA